MTEKLSADARKWEKLYEECEDLYEEGSFDRAEKKLTEAVALARSLREENEDWLGMSLNLLAGVYRATGRDEEALRANQEALEIARRTRNEDDYDLAGAYNNVAQLLENVGRHQEAIEHFERAIELKNRILGEDHPHISMSLYGIGQAWLGLGNRQKAEEYFKRAVEQAGRKPGFEDLIRSTMVYGSFLEEQERTGDLIALLRQTISRSEQWLSEPAGNFNILDPEEAYAAALKEQYQEQGYGPQPLVELQSKLAESLFQEEEEEEALALQKKVVHAFVSALGEDDPGTGDAFLRYAIMLHNAGRDEEEESSPRLAEAEYNYKKAIAAYEEDEEEYAPDCAEACLSLAELYLDLGREEEAREQLDRADELLEDIEDEEEIADLRDMQEELRERLEEE